MGPEPSVRPVAVEAEPRRRLLETAYALFTRHGIQSVGIDRIVDEARVAKMTLYRHFPSKDDLALACLLLHEERWTIDWLLGEMERRSADPAKRLLIAFDLLGEWFGARDFWGCPFIRTLLETPDHESPLRAAAMRHLETIRAILAGIAEKAGLRDPADVASRLQMLMIGAIVAASRGDTDAAVTARQMAEGVLHRFAPAG